jgi:hypothetical protein
MQFAEWFKKPCEPKGLKAIAGPRQTVFLIGLKTIGPGAIACAIVSHLHQHGRNVA